MSIIRNVEKYQTSRDYELLAEIMKQTSIICIVDHDGCRDVCHTIFTRNDRPKALFNEWQLSGYIWSDSKRGFMAQCERLNLEFLIPDLTGGDDRFMFEGRRLSGAD